MSIAEVEGLLELTKDLREAAKTLSKTEARYLVDSYYMMQENRKRAANQVRALSKTGEPHAVITWAMENSTFLEEQIRGVLHAFSKSDPLGVWAMSVKGIAGVITAGLLANIDIEKASTAGAVWRFAGQDPTSVWEKGKKRPWNASLKRLCWIIGESFVKVSGRKGAIYGEFYLKRKEYEWQNNLGGKLTGQAGARTEGKGAVGKSTDAWPWYAGKYRAEDVKELLETGVSTTEWKKKLKRVDSGGLPMLPPAQIHSRAKRYAVKLFLAHYFEKGCKLAGRPVPSPYPIAHLGHVDWIKVSD